MGTQSEPAKRGMRSRGPIALSAFAVTVGLLAGSSSSFAASPSAGPAASNGSSAGVVCPDGAPTRGNGKKQFGWAIGLSELPI